MTVLTSSLTVFDLARCIASRLRFTTGLGCEILIASCVTVAHDLPVVFKGRADKVQQ